MTSHSTTTKANRPLAPMPPTPPTLAPPSQSPNPKETIKAVIIRCPSTAYPIDNNNNSTTNRFYQSLPIAPLEIALHLSDTPLSIPSLVDLPLWMRSRAWTGPHGDQRKPQSEQDIENTIARPLCFVADPGSPNFGNAPMVRGDSLFGRMDGRDLSCQHLGCLVSFAEVVVREFGRQMEGLEGKKRGREEGDARKGW